MLEPTILIGSPLIFNNKIKIYPPTVREVVANPNFGVFYKILTFTQEDVKDEVKGKLQEGEPTPTPFEYLLINCAYANGFFVLLQGAFALFCRSKVKFDLGSKKLWFCDLEDKEENWRLLEEEEFFDFQNKVRVVMGDKPVPPPLPEDPNEDPRIRRIKEKARERDRIKAKQGTKGGISLSTCLAAICCMGIGLTPLNIGEMSYASVGELMRMMQEKEKYDIDVRSLLAGADSKKVKPKYWIRNSD